MREAAPFREKADSGGRVKRPLARLISYKLKRTHEPCPARIPDQGVGGKAAKTVLESWCIGLDMSKNIEFIVELQNFKRDGRADGCPE